MNKQASSLPRTLSLSLSLAKTLVRMRAEPYYKNMFEGTWCRVSTRGHAGSIEALISACWPSVMQWVSTRPDLSDDVVNALDRPASDDQRVTYTPLSA